MAFESPTGGHDLFTRVVSAFPVSIGTSLALESLFPPRQKPYDPEREMPEHVDVSGYQECWINLATMFRNIVGAVDKMVLLTAHESEFKDTLLQEMEVIDSLFQNEGNGTCKPHYYFCTYDALYKRTDKAVKFREDKTDAQKSYNFKMMKTLELLMKETENAQRLDSSIRPAQRVDSLMISHFPYDLISHHNFSKLSLLESHSGKLKNKNQWYSKYYPVGIEDLSHMPFLRKLLLVFGDRVLIQPGDLRLRKQILEIAQKRQWTPMTTEPQVLQHIELDIKEPFVVNWIKSL